MGVLDIDAMRKGSSRGMHSQGGHARARTEQENLGDDTIEKGIAREIGRLIDWFRGQYAGVHTYARNRVGL